MAAIKMSESMDVFNEISEIVKTDFGITDKKILLVSKFGFIIKGRDTKSDAISDRQKPILMERKIGFAEVPDSAGIDINVELDLKS